jgi:hypothetical protein
MRCKFDRRNPAAACTSTARWAGLAGLALAAALGACSHPRYYADAEVALTTGDFFASQGHFAVYYPSEIALDFPGYVIGIETGDRSALMRDGDLHLDRLAPAGHSMLRLIGQLRDGRASGEAFYESDRVPFVSQVIRYRGRPLGEGNCALFNAYQGNDQALVPFCNSRPLPNIGRWPTYRGAFADSWTAIDALKGALDAEFAAGRPTHLVVAMMGWRTTQEEAIRNFNSLMRATALAAPADFRPLFIGITWVGPWSGRWFDPLLEVSAYGNIADLADILGLTWVGVLTDEVLLPLSTRVPVTWITHSFGARAATTATCIGPAIRRGAGFYERPEGVIERVIGFQAAFSLMRFDPKRRYVYEDVHFPNDCDRARSIVLTTSRHDQASKSILWADLAGNYRYFKSFCRRQSGVAVSCAAVDETGAIEGSHDPAARLLYLDATRLIRFRAPGTDGGSHSDIFRPPAGRLVWSLMATPIERPSGAAR